jgi:hypothetical protein
MKISMRLSRATRPPSALAHRLTEIFYPDPEAQCFTGTAAAPTCTSETQEE